MVKCFEYKQSELHKYKVKNNIIPDLLLTHHTIRKTDFTAYFSLELSEIFFSLALSQELTSETVM